MLEIIKHHHITLNSVMVQNDESNISSECDLQAVPS